MIIKVTYQTFLGPREKLLSLDEVAEFGRRWDWPGVQRIAEDLIKGSSLNDRDRLALERAFELDQNRLSLETFGEDFEVELA
jgi:hypothetical protein